MRDHVDGSIRKWRDATDVDFTQHVGVVTARGFRPEQEVAIPDHRQAGGVDLEFALQLWHPLGLQQVLERLTLRQRGRVIEARCGRWHHAWHRLRPRTRPRAQCGPGGCGTQGIRGSTPCGQRGRSAFRVGRTPSWKKLPRGGSVVPHPAKTFLKTYMRITCTSKPVSAHAAIT